MAKRIDQVRMASVYGLRTDRTFRAAATKFLEENQHKRSLADDAKLLKQLAPFIGDLMLRQVHMGSLQSFIAKRRAKGVKTRSINNALSLVRHILNLAASEWRDEKGLTWLEYAPKIKLLKVTDGRSPYPLSRDEQAFFFPGVAGAPRQDGLAQEWTGSPRRAESGRSVHHRISARAAPELRVHLQPALSEGEAG